MSPQSTHWLVRILAWDGLLPVIVAVTSLIFRAACRDEALAGCVGVVLLPLTAAMIRSHIALGQVKEVCRGEAPVLRQIAIAAAIVNMLIFEVFVNGFALTDKEPLEVWAIPGGFYLVYLAFICWALRPLPMEPAEEAER